MARKLRYEEKGGLYHVINRGNYRNPVFGSVGAAQAFEKTLWEAIRLHGWRLHAYMLMSNHYHLALETPSPNLVDGMHWLQSTFATRFNRLRNERGHLFQGRYQALAVENAAALSAVVDYIHLNPLRAKIVTLELLEGFRWSSLRPFLRGERPEGLTGETVMAHWKLTDSTEGWASYLERLKRLAQDEEEQKRLGFESFSKGWAIGTSAWKAAVAKTFAQLDLVGLARDEARAVKLDRWQVLLDEGLAKAGKSPEDLKPLQSRARGEPWRWELATQLRANGVDYGWIAKSLGYASPASLRVRMHRERSVNN
jgi:REP element-mobilizing transposase RayT